MLLPRNNIILKTNIESCCLTELGTLEKESVNTMFWKVSADTQNNFDDWRKEQDDKVKILQERKIAYYGAIGGAIEYTFYSNSLKGMAKNNITDEEFHFEYEESFDVNSLDKSYLVKFDEWKKEGHDYAFKFCPTSLGASLFVIDLQTNEEKNITDYSDW